MILTKQVQPVKEIMRRMRTEESWLRAKDVTDLGAANG